MKILVDKLPYNKEVCPLAQVCNKSSDLYECPRFWSKDKILDYNPRECNLLMEIEEWLATNKGI